MIYYKSNLFPIISSLINNKRHFLILNKKNNAFNATLTTIITANKKHGKMALHYKLNKDICHDFLWIYNDYFLINKNLLNIISK